MRTTRRNVLKGGGKAVAAVAALPILSTINPAQAQEDAELFALYDEYRRLEKEYAAAEARACEAACAVRRQFPAVAPDIALDAQLGLPGTPEHEACFNHPDGFLRRRKALVQAAKQKWDADLVKAKEQAGVPVLEKKERAACDAWLGALHRFLAIRANTPAGMILKFKIAWCDKQERSWQQTHSDDDVEFWPDAMASVLVDLERLSGRAI